MPITGNPYQSTHSGTRSAWIATLDMLPDGTARGAGSGPHCEGAMIIEIDRQPTAGTVFDVLIGNAPRNGTGALLIGPAPIPCIPIAGAELCILPWVVESISAGPKGSAAYAIGSPASAACFPFAVQAIWLENGSCSGAELLASTPTLDIKLN